MTAATCNGITLEYECQGEGEPLLLIMGLGGQLVSWPADWVSLFVECGFQVIRFDNRDIGLSTMTPGEPPTLARTLAAVASRRLATASYTIDDMADDAAGLLDHLGLARAHVLGVSMGGMIAQALTIRHPQRVASLTSIMSNTGDRRRGRVHRSLLAKAAKVRSKTPDDFVDTQALLFKLISGPHYDEAEIRTLAKAALARHYDATSTMFQTMAIAASPDRTAGLHKLTAPTLVVHGLVDRLVLPSGGIATAKAVPGSRLLMFPDMGHDLPRPRWVELAEAILENCRRGGFSGGRA